MSIPRPSILFDFLATQHLDPRLVFTRSTGANGRATRFDQRGWMVDVPQGQPRFDHTIDGVPLGLLIETGPTINYNYNPRMEGSGGGALSSGNLPNAWIHGGMLAGLTVTRLADQVLNGMNGCVLRFQGTVASTSAINFGPSPVTVASTVGWTWTGSAYLAMVGGSPTGINSVRVRCFGSGGTVNEQQIVPGTMTAKPQRYSATNTTTVTNSAMHIQVWFAAGAVIDFSLWIGPTQHETRSFATSQVLPIPGTTNATSERRIEKMTCVLADFGITGLEAEGTMMVSWFAPDIPVSQSALELSDDSQNNFIRFNRNPDQLNVHLMSGGVSQAIVYAGGSLADNAVHAVAAAWKANDVQVCANGALGAQDTDAVMPAALTLLSLGGAQNAGNMLNGHLRHVAIFQRRLADAVLQKLTS